MKPYVQKQIMPEFRERVAKSRMLAVIAPDVEEARALMEVTSAVLGEEVGPPPTRIEKTKTIIALAEVAMRPYELTKTCLSKPGGAADSDDDVRVSLDEFPMRIYAPSAKEKTRRRRRKRWRRRPRERRRPRTLRR